MDFKALYKKVEPFMAIAILILLLTVAIQIPQTIKLNTEIKENCGWQDEKIRCICERSQVELIEQIQIGDYNFDNISVQQVS